MTARTLAAATIIAIAVHPSSRAERAPRGAAQALTTGQRHHYTVAARVRPLLFWIGKDDIGDAVVAAKRDGDIASYALLIGSDPERAPRNINRWGYIAEDIHGDEATLVGLMTESDEDSVGQAEANVRKEAGNEIFNVIRASIASGEARSVVTSVAAPSAYTLRQVDTVLELADQRGVDSKARVVRLPPGGRPGFLSALADVMQEQAATWRSAGKLRPTQPIAYVYHGKVYQLRVTQSRSLASQRIGASTYERLIASQFQIKQAATNEVTDFSITYGADGPLTGLPVAATYQPRWWLEIQLTLDDARRGPLGSIETTR
jgi:hypothetical protein